MESVRPKGAGGRQGSLGEAEMKAGFEIRLKAGRFSSPVGRRIEIEWRSLNSRTQVGSMGDSTGAGIGLDLGAASS
ncbi:hypothetical protein Tco_0893842 [Tanacetum coccineum]|uniref:Uncharacterized protein n=1 Tax=Tanacetum coccineum TaxID=301880 RepID=A0ABQ5CA02_9ASTR